MTTESRAVGRPAGQRRRRLDLFAFPSDTHGWFRMLVVVACLVGVNIGFLTARRAHGLQEGHARERLSTFMTEMMRGHDLRDYSPPEMAELGRRLSPIVRELLRSQIPSLVTSALFTLLLLVAAGAIYLDHPRRYRRRLGGKPLSEREAPTVVRDVTRWSASLDLPQPRLEHRPGIGNDAQAFGLRGRETLMFDAAPSLLESVWSETPKVVALHELGHIKNGDIQEREASKAIWIALLGFLLLAACFLAGPSLADLISTWRTAGAAKALASLAVLGRPLLQYGWRIAALLFLAAATWIQLVRAFELYADRRVATWGKESALQQQLRLLTSERLRHPTKGRKAMLEHPGQTFRISPALSFMTGALLGVLTVSLVFPVLELAFDASLAGSMGFWQVLAPHVASLPAPWNRQLLLGATLIFNLGRLASIFLVPLAVLSYLVSGTLGVQVQREAVGDLETGNPRAWGYARLWRPAALLALGAEAGFRTAPFSSGLDLSLDARLFTLWLAGMTCFTWLWLAYVRALTRFTLGMHVGTTLSRRLRRIVTIASVMLLTALYWPAGFARLVPRIYLWARITPLMPRADPQETFVYSIVMTGVILATLAIVTYLAAASVSLTALLTRLWCERPRCPACGEPTGLQFAVGHSCVHCQQPLASWAYENTVDLDRLPEKGAP